MHTLPSLIHSASEIENYIPFSKDSMLLMHLHFFSLTAVFSAPCPSEDIIQTLPRPQYLSEDSPLMQTFCSILQMVLKIQLSNNALHALHPSTQVSIPYPPTLLISFCPALMHRPSLTHFCFSDL